MASFKKPTKQASREILHIVTAWKQCPTHSKRCSATPKPHNQERAAGYRPANMHIAAIVVQTATQIRCQFGKAQRAAPIAGRSGAMKQQRGGSRSNQPEPCQSPGPGHKIRQLRSSRGIQRSDARSIPESVAPPQRHTATIELLDSNQQTRR